jgi:hypothetical protein
MVFWINLYNALIIHAVIAYGIEKKVNEVRGIFEKAAYIVGGYRFSANDIEHGILRANAGHPALPGAQFGKDDPRRDFCLPELDPRVHFALVCAAQSCPPISFYQAVHLDEQLNLAARNFLGDGGMIVDRDKKQIKLSRIFSWYAQDFGGRLFGYVARENLLHCVIAYLDSSPDATFVRENAAQMTIKFVKYDWSLNV